MFSKTKLNYIFNKLSLAITSMRPTTWIRFWAEMIVAAAIAGKASFNPCRFLLGFFSLGPALWGAAYILNDLTDIKLDLQHPLKRYRPITSGNLTQKESLFFVFLLFTLAFGGSLFINLSFTLTLLLLTLSEILYTLPPFRFKERFGLDLFINGFNSALKFTGGYLTQAGAFNHKTFPWLPLLFFVCLKTLLFLGHRLQSREIEVRNKLNSTVARFSLQKLRILFGFLATTALLFYFLSIRNNYFPLISISFFPISFILLLPCLVGFKKEGLIHPERSLTFRVHLYLAYFVFTNLLASFILLKK